MILKHLKVILIHKWYVFIECCKEGIIWQGIIHDLSKFSPAEFIPSAKYFQGNSSPIEAEKAEKGYSYAWLHHKGHNKHHWQYWVDWEKDKVITPKIPLKYMKEMYADLVGASKAYNKEKYNPSEPLKYFNNNVQYWLINPISRDWLRNKLILLSKNGKSSNV